MKGIFFPYPGNPVICALGFMFLFFINPKVLTFSYLRSMLWVPNRSASVRCRPWWLRWMHVTGDLEVAGLTPRGVGNILSWILIMKYFL